MDSQKKYSLHFLTEKSVNREKQQAIDENPRVKSNHPINYENSTIGYNKKRP